MSAEVISLVERLTSSPSQVDPPDFGLSEEETTTINKSAMTISFAMAAELDKMKLMPTIPEEVKNLALDLSFFHEIATAIILRCMRIEHPLQVLMSECLELAT